MKIMEQSENVELSTATPSNVTSLDSTRAYSPYKGLTGGAARACRKDEESRTIGRAYAGAVIPGGGHFVYVSATGFAHWAEEQGIRIEYSIADYEGRGENLFHEEDDKVGDWYTMSLYNGNGEIRYTFEGDATWRVQLLLNIDAPDGIENRIFGMMLHDAHTSGVDIVVDAAVDQPRAQAFYESRGFAEEPVSENAINGEAAEQSQTPRLRWEWETPCPTDINCACHDWEEAQAD